MTGAFGWLAGSGAVLMGGLLLSSPWVLVEVKETQPDGVHVFVPAPVGLAHLAVPFLPENKIPLDIPLEAEDREAVSRMLLASLDELERLEDFHFVRVESRDETVLIRKEDAFVTVKVDNDEEDVFVRAPIASARRLVSQYDAGRNALTFGDVLLAADEIPSGKLVDVQAPDARVQVWVW